MRLPQRRKCSHLECREKKDVRVSPAFSNVPVYLPHHLMQAIEGLPKSKSAGAQCQFILGGENPELVYRPYKFDIVYIKDYYIESSEKQHSCFTQRPRRFVWTLRYTFHLVELLPKNAARKAKPTFFSRFHFIYQPTLARDEMSGAIPRDEVNSPQIPIWRAVLG